MNEEKIVCGSCGFQNLPGSVFCGECGKKLAESAESEAETTPEAEEAVSETPAEIETENTSETEETVTETEETPAEHEAESPTETEAEIPTETEAETAPELEETTPAKAVKKLPIKPILLIGGGVLVLLIISLIISTAISGGSVSGIYIKNLNTPGLAAGDESDRGAVLGYDKDPIVIEKEDGGSAYLYQSRNGAGSLVFADLDDETVLYYITAKTDTVINEENFGNAFISDNGNAFAYIYGKKSDEKTLVLYRDGKTEVLSDEASIDVGVKISPDGSAVSWAEDFDRADNSFKTMLYTGGKTEEFGKNLDILAVADNAKFVYYQKGDSVYVQKAFNSDDRIKIASSDDAAYAYMNSDYSQALVYAVDEYGDIRTYLYESGKDPVKLSNDSLYPILPEGYNTVGDFKKAIYYTEGKTYNNIYNLDKELNDNRIVSETHQYKVSPDGKEMLYAKGQSLYRVDTSGDKKETELYNDVTEFAASADLKHIYFVTEDGEICYLKEKLKAETVTYDYDAYTVSGSDIYYIDGTEIYKGTKGRGKLLGEIDYNSRDIENIWLSVYDNGQIVISVYDDEWNITSFVSKDGKTFFNTEDL